MPSPWSGSPNSLLAFVLLAKSTPEGGGRTRAKPEQVVGAAAAGFEIDRDFDVVGNVIGEIDGGDLKIIGRVVQGHIRAPRKFR